MRPFVKKLGSSAFFVLSNENDRFFTSPFKSTTLEKYEDEVSITQLLIFKMSLEEDSPNEKSSTRSVRVYLVSRSLDQPVYPLARR
jgi:hypothetical protein